MKTTILIAVSLIALPLHADILSGPIVNPSNGHSYYLLTSNTWTASQVEAVSLGGNLATINDAAENDWVFDTFSQGQSNLWIGLYDPNFNGTYSWVDGSALSYSNWDTGPSPQPDGGSDHWVFIAPGDLGHGLTARKWHDVVDNPDSEFSWIGPMFGVVAKPCYPHRATATASIVNGFLVAANITDGGCGYTNPPVVLVLEGGGSGATASAVISGGGVVVAINITIPGSGYLTNPPPRIEIASPPFAPWLSIAVSRVNVSQHVQLGKNYVLEASSDLVTWTATGPPFMAESEEITTEFVVDASVKYFRIRQVP